MLAQFGGCQDWEQRLQRGQTETSERALRPATRTGAPFADAAFRAEIERQLKLAVDRRAVAAIESVKARTAAEQAR